MATVRLVPFGIEHADESLADIAAQLRRRLGLRVSVQAQEVDPEPGYSAGRGQYDASYLLQALERQFSRGRVVGITELDLYLSVFTFVIGLARLNGRAAVVSTHRLRPESFGMPADPVLLRERLYKEVVHELGHSFGLPHCRDPGCVMRSAAIADEVDLKSDLFCDSCLGVFQSARTGM